MAKGNRIHCMIFVEFNTLKNVEKSASLKPNHLNSCYIFTFLFCVETFTLYIPDYCTVQGCKASFKNKNKISLEQTSLQYT